MSEAPPPFDALWFRLVLGFIVGLALGSFATMLSYRLPRRMSVLHPRSHCPFCLSQLKMRDLIPVLSWLLTGGKCRNCGVMIGVRYPLIELVTAAASMAAFGIIGLTPQLGIALIGIVGLVTLTAIKIERR